MGSWNLFLSVIAFLVMITKVSTHAISIDLSTLNMVTAFNNFVKSKILKWESICRLRWLEDNTITISQIFIVLGWFLKDCLSWVNHSKGLQLVRIIKKLCWSWSKNWHLMIYNVESRLFKKCSMGLERKKNSNQIRSF